MWSAQASCPWFSWGAQDLLREQEPMLLEGTSKALAECPQP